MHPLLCALCVNENYRFKNIAHNLGIQECTVKARIRDVIKKLNATVPSSQTGLAKKRQSVAYLGTWLP